MHNESFMRTYSPRQKAMAQAGTRQQAAVRTASTAPTSDLLVPYMVKSEPYYRAVADEVELYEAAYSVRMPMMLKGPTGCGKTRFVEYMAWKLNKHVTKT
jgi:nitric oxide reductase NorQ protein